MKKIQVFCEVLLLEAKPSGFLKHFRKNNEQIVKYVIEAALYLHRIR